MSADKLATETAGEPPYVFQRGVLGMDIIEPRAFLSSRTRVL